ncbi:MAG: sugar phosphate isomerase/epimerase [Candidatus Acidiferrum sp.]
MNRRTFLETSIATAVLTSLPSKSFAATHQIEKVGVQLYTVRELMKSDFEGTIAKVAAIGYKEVEFAGLFNHSPKDVRALLDKVGLTASSSHVGYDIVESHWPETIEAAKIMGQSYIVCPGIPDDLRKQPGGYKRVAELFNKAGEASNKAGIKFAYHNHTWEFQPTPLLGGKRPYDFLLDSTDPKFCNMEMDLCWAEVAGQDPVSYFNRYPGRFPLVHVKDMKKLPKPSGDNMVLTKLDTLEADMTDVGSGVIDWKRIFASADKAGIKHFIVENDWPKDAFASLTNSYNYLSKLRF